MHQHVRILYVWYYCVKNQQLQKHVQIYKIKARQKARKWFCIWINRQKTEALKHEAADRIGSHLVHVSVMKP